MKLKPLKNTTEAETSICLFKTGGPSMLGTPGGKTKINTFLFYNKNSLKKVFHNQEFRNDSYFSLNPKQCILKAAFIGNCHGLQSVFTNY